MIKRYKSKFRHYSIGGVARFVDHYCETNDPYVQSVVEESADYGVVVFLDAVRPEKHEIDAARPAAGNSESEAQGGPLVKLPIKVSADVEVVNGEKQEQTERSLLEVFTAEQLREMLRNITTTPTHVIASILGPVGIDISGKKRGEVMRMFSNKIKSDLKRAGNDIE